MLPVIVLIGTISFCAFANAAQPPKERQIARLPIEKNEPLAITGMKVIGEPVAFGRPFIAEDDWIRTLVISVKNTSNKRILFLNFDLLFRYPTGSKESLAMFHLLSYGNSALQRRLPLADEQRVGLAPGESTAVQLSDKKFSDFQKFIAELRVPDSIEKVDLKIGRVIFDDDSMWSGGTFRRDPNNPSSWDNVSP